MEEREKAVDIVGVIRVAILGNEIENGLPIVYVHRLPPVTIWFPLATPAHHIIVHRTAGRVGCVAWMVTTTAPWCFFSAPLAPNAGPQAPPIAAATQERRLLAVACRPMLGAEVAPGH